MTGKTGDELRERIAQTLEKTLDRFFETVGRDGSEGPYDYVQKHAPDAILALLEPGWRALDEKLLEKVWLAHCAQHMTDLSFFETREIFRRYFADTPQPKSEGERDG